jgi:hypothetical protein
VSRAGRRTVGAPVVVRRVCLYLIVRRDRADRGRNADTADITVDTGAFRRGTRHPLQTETRTTVRIKFLPVSSTNVLIPRILRTELRVATIVPAAPREWIVTSFEFTRYLLVCGASSRH